MANLTQATEDFRQLEAAIYANHVRGNVAAFTECVAKVPTRRLRAAYRAAYVPCEGNRAAIIRQACERASAALAARPEWRSPIGGAA